MQLNRKLRNPYILPKCRIQIVKKIPLVYRAAIFIQTKHWNEIVVVFVKENLWTEIFVYIALILYFITPFGIYSYIYTGINRLKLKSMKWRYCSGLNVTKNVEISISIGGFENNI